MNISDVYSSIQKQLNRRLPFVIYRKAGSLEVKSILQKDDMLYKAADHTKSGFVFAPFDSKWDAILMPSEESVHLTTRYSRKQQQEIQPHVDKTILLQDDAIAKANHENLVHQGIKTIQSGSLQKVVLSRKEEISLSGGIDGLQLFDRLLQSYPNAFVYYWFHPKVGTWLGATPETLLKIKDQTLATMALAGTQPYQKNKQVVWKSKEIEEQQMVAQFISRELSNKVKTITTSETYTHRAGSLLHLRTDITANLDIQKFNLQDILTVLHPTPAVCGVPKKEAMDFIKKQEGYDRKFYTGFLGEYTIKNNRLSSADLFVNLRCMEVKNDLAFLYVGGGITKDSIVEKEWEETVNKTATMKKVLFV